MHIRLKGTPRRSRAAFKGSDPVDFGGSVAHMKQALALVLLVAGCSNPSTAPTASGGPSSFCDPVIATYEQIDPSDTATVRALVVAISDSAFALDEINRAVFVAHGAELQVTVTGGVWSTAKLADDLSTVCDVDLPVLASP
jgi:hypothetical protein